MIKNTEELINLFPKKDKKNLFYRSMNNGKNFAKIIKKKNPNINLSDLKRDKFKDIQNDIKLAICMYPETVIVDLITNGIPTLIYIPKNLYSFDKNSNKMIQYLKRNNIYFDNLKNLKLHLDKIINSPNDWWSSKSNQLILKNFKNNFFKMEEDYILKWNQIIKKI
jgi:putative transferase (TIGR04331 family)